MKEAECEYYKQQFDLKKNNMKQIWRNLNQACSLSIKKENQGVSELIDNGERITDNSLISNVLNKLFLPLLEKNCRKNCRVSYPIHLFHSRTILIALVKIVCLFVQYHMRN